VAVSCDFEHPFMCGYIPTTAGKFSWERVDSSDVRHMQKTRRGRPTNVVLLHLV